jgi:hypothetical protein
MRLGLCALVVGGMLTTSCITIGEEFESEVTWIQTGKTTRAEVDGKMGAPFRMGYDDGQFSYTYAFYRYSIFRPTRTKDLVVRFRPDGSVASYTFSSSFAEDKTKMSSSNR